MADTFTLAQTAQAVGLSARQFRKVWPVMVRRQGFPPPFRSPDTGGNYAWDANAVLGWRASPPLPAPTPANDPRPAQRPMPASERAQALRVLAYIEGRG